MIHSGLTRKNYARIVTEKVANPSPKLALTMVSVLFKRPLFEYCRVFLSRVLGGTQSSPTSVVDPAGIQEFYTESRRVCSISPEGQELTPLPAGEADDPSRTYVFSNPELPNKALARLLVNSAMVKPWSDRVDEPCRMRDAIIMFDAYLCPDGRPSTVYWFDRSPGVAQARTLLRTAAAFINLPYR